MRKIWPKKKEQMRKFKEKNSTNSLKTKMKIWPKLKEKLVGAAGQKEIVWPHYYMGKGDKKLSQRSTLFSF